MPVRWPNLLAHGAVLALAARGTIGAGSVTRDRMDYTDAVPTFWKEQTPSNIVKRHHADAPAFMIVTSTLTGGHRIRIALDRVPRLHALVDLRGGRPAAMGTAPVHRGGLL